MQHTVSAAAALTVPVQGGIPHRAFSAFVFNTKNGGAASRRAPSHSAVACSPLFSMCSARALDAAAIRREDPVSTELGQQLLLPPVGGGRALPWPDHHSAHRALHCLRLPQVGQACSQPGGSRWQGEANGAAGTIQAARRKLEQELGIDPAELPTECFQARHSVAPLLHLRISLLLGDH